MSIAKSLTVLATEIAKSVTALVGPRVAHRHHEETLAADARAQIEALRIHELKSHLDLARERELLSFSRYPLGHPGRLRSILPPGLAPCLLVSPSPMADPTALSEAVAAHIREFDDSQAFLRTITGAFVRDGAVYRSLGGGVDAAEVVACEFSPRPSIVVHFSQARGAVTAHGLVTGCLKTVDETDQFEMPLARLRGDELEYASWGPLGSGSRNLEWVAWRPEHGSLDAADAMAQAIAMFALSISAIYWQLQGVQWKLGRDEVNPMAAALAAADGTEADDSTRDARLGRDLAALISAGASVETSTEPYAVLVSPPTGARVLFELPDDYPTSPPQMFVDRDGEIEQLIIAAEHWSPARSLNDLLEAVA